MPKPQQIFRHLLTFRPVIHRNIGKLHLFDSIRQIHTDRAENKGDIQLSDFFLGMLKFTAQKYNTPKPLLLFQLQGHVHLILLSFHMTQHQSILIALCLLLNNPDHIAEKGVRDTFHQNGNTFGICPLQISGTVVGNKPRLLNHPEDHASCLRIDIRMIIQCSGYGADPNSAFFCDILNRNLSHLNS